MDNQYSKNEAGDSSQSAPGKARDNTNLPHFGLLGPDGKPLPETEEPEAPQETYRKIAEAETRISKWVVIWAAVTAIATVTQVGIAWYSNHSTGRIQTDQFNQMKSVSDRMEGAAKSFAGNSSNINQGIGSAVIQLQTQADKMDAARTTSEKNSTDSLQATIGNFHQDQRAWVYPMSFLLSNEPTESNPSVGITVAIVNSGKTPALAPELLTQPFLFQGIPPPQQWTVTPTEKPLIPPGQTGDFTIGPVLLTFDQPIKIAAYKNGITQIYITGRIGYDDVFRRPHWLEYCAFHTREMPLNKFRFCGMTMDEPSQ